MAVTFEVKKSEHGLVGIALLNRPQVLNSLNLEMCRDMFEKFAEWKAARELACLFLHGNGEKGLCAGGDVKAVREAIVKSKHAPDEFQYVVDFFTYEYLNDYKIYQIEKPIVAWASGITMGGGLGLIRGATIRVVTETSLFAMPEIAIGLYPDVGAAHFLNRLPKGIGMFLGATGMRITGAQAFHLGLATHYVPERKRGQVLDRLLRQRWSLNSKEDQSLANAILAQFHQAQEPDQDWLGSLEKLREISQAPDFVSWADGLSKAAETDSWIAEGVARWKGGSPLSIRLSYEYIKMSENLNLAQVFEGDFNLSMNFSLQDEFPEGVRSLLVDKDGQPNWKFKDPRDIPQAVLQDLMKKRPEYSGLFLQLLRS